MTHLAISTKLKAFQHNNDKIVHGENNCWKQDKKIPVGIISGKFSEHSVAALDCYTARRKCPALVFVKDKLGSHCSEGKGFQEKEMAHS